MDVDSRALRRSRSGAGLTESTPQGITVDAAVVLAIDMSGSVSDDRVRLQFQGYAAALRNPAFLPALRRGRTGRVALTFVEWSEAQRQEQAVGWRIIRDAGDRDAFVTAMLEADRPTPGWTSISGAIDFAAGLLRYGGFVTDRRVIDISGDGENNDGRSVAEARDAAVAAGITINGLPITDVEPELEAYYRRNVIGGQNSFLIAATGMQAFTEAVLRKLLVEIAGGPPEAALRRAGFAR